MIGRPPVRFLIGLISLWAGGRAYWLFGAADVSRRAAVPACCASPPRASIGAGAASTAISSLTAPASMPGPAVCVARRRDAVAGGAAALLAPTAGLDVARTDRAEETPETALRPTTSLPIASIVAIAPSPDRFAGSAWLFVRSGSGRAALAPGGQLGGSQAGGRLSLAVSHSLALAARFATPLHDAGGAEAALGVDWTPLDRVALRISAERRIALGDHARDAWSLYAAGGATRRVGPVEIDGYAQAGIVGVRRRDLFADAALRVGRRVAGDGRYAIMLGVGAWGAAQPGVARLDLGPRVSLALPIAGGTASLALEGRIRVAGQAAPGSGIALTLASDF